METKFLDNFTDYDYPMFGWVRLPSIEITDKERASISAPEDCSNYEFLRRLAFAGFKKMCPLAEKQEWTDRTKRELELLDKLGYIDYILFVWKAISGARNMSISVGPGRGSVAGSLVAYLIGITEIPPIKYKLFFERFVSEARSRKKEVDGITYIDGSLAPDIDIDLEQKRRHEVVEYVKTLYPGRVVKISNVSTLSGKALIKACGKIIGEISEEEMKLVADMIPKKFGIVADIEDAYYGKKDDKGEWKQEPVEKFIEWVNQNPLHGRIFKTALKLRDLVKNKSSHASGYVISHDLLENYIPCELAKKKKQGSDELSDEKEIVSSFTMEDVAYLTIKVDFLGLRCLSVIADVLNQIKLNKNEINLDDNPDIYGQLQDLRSPHGLFQIEAHTNFQVNNSVKPKNLSELSDVLAMARPGALAYVHDYTENTKESPHQLFDAILKPSRNVCLYQEQMMQLVHALGFSLEDAERVRRIVGKKKVEEMVEWQEKVKSMAKSQGFEETIGEMVWKILDDSAAYSFNKCLSPDTMIETEAGEYKPMFEVKVGDKIKSFNYEKNEIINVEVEEIYHNEVELYEVELEDGRKIKCSMDHKFLCEENNMVRLEEIIITKKKITCE